MSTLARPDAAVFEEYLLVCSRWRAAVEDVGHYVRAMKIAAQRPALLKRGRRGITDCVVVDDSRATDRPRQGPQTSAARFNDHFER
jgi:hypothetical protein